MVVDIRFLFLVFLCALPFVCTIFFALPVSDDFAMAKDIIPNGISLAEIIQKTNEQYMNWMGLWPFFFLEYLLNPLYVLGYYKYATGVFLISTFLLFIYVLYIYIKNIMEHILKIENDKAIKTVYILLLIAFFNSAIYDEIYYWFVGNVYLWNVIFMMWNQILIIKLFKSEMSKPQYIILCFIGFIACFAFQLDLFSGIIYLVEIIKYLREHGKFETGKLYPLLFMILGGVISVFAPGNFARSKSYTTEIKVGDALINALSNNAQCLLKSVENPYFIIMLFCFVVIGYLYLNNSNRVSITLLIAMALVSLFGLTFSVALGYSNADIPNRILFMINFIIYMYLGLIFIQIGAKISEMNLIDTNAIIAIAIVLCISALFGELGINNYGTIKAEKRPWYVTITSIDKVKKEYDYNMSVLRACYNKEDKKNLEIYFDYNAYEETHILKGIGFESQEVVENIRICSGNEEISVIVIPKH